MLVSSYFPDFVEGSSIYSTINGTLVYDNHDIRGGLNRRHLSVIDSDMYSTLSDIDYDNDMRSRSYVLSYSKYRLLKAIHHRLYLSKFFEYIDRQYSSLCDAAAIDGLTVEEYYDRKKIGAYFEMLDDIQEGV